MGTLHDRAIARAERKLRQRLESAQTDKLVKHHPLDVIVPQWIAFAAEYAIEVVMAFAAEVLDPKADDPFQRIEHLKQHTEVRH